MTLSQFGRYEAATTPRLGTRAVVVGGGMAGMCTARVLADAFDDVVVLERDTLPDGPAIRDGAPQTGQPHAMLEAGRAVLCDLFPGFEAAVRDAGGLKIDMIDDIDWYNRGGVVAAPETSLPALYASRPLFEHVVREQLRTGDGVRLRDDCQFVEYEHDDDARRVTGVRFRNESGTEATLDAALTVDATGRTSRTPAWLDRHGYPTPSVDEVRIDVTYSSVRIERPPGVHTGALIAPEPHRPRGAAMLPIEDGQWEVLLQGVHGERAPADRATFRQWANTLPLDEIGRRVGSQQWVSEIRRYPFPVSVRRHYDDLGSFPDGLIVVGDAIASFNPMYGQGMSVGALEALALHHELSAGLDALGPRFFEQASDVVHEAWLTAVGSDFVFPETTGPKPFAMDVLNGYVGRLVERAHEDGTLSEAFLRVFRMERRATSLLHPRILWRVFGPRHGRP